MEQIKLDLEQLKAGIELYKKERLNSPRSIAEDFIGNNLNIISMANQMLGKTELTEKQKHYTQMVSAEIYKLNKRFREEILPLLEYDNPIICHTTHCQSRSTDEKST